MHDSLIKSDLAFLGQCRYRYCYDPFQVDLLHTMFNTNVPIREEPWFQLHKPPRRLDVMPAPLLLRRRSLMEQFRPPTTDYQLCLGQQSSSQQICSSSKKLLRREKQLPKTPKKLEL